MYEEIISLLPRRISEQFSKHSLEGLSEIRLISGRPISLTFGEESKLFSDIITEAEMKETVLCLCRGSLHSYGEAMKNGYIPLDNGCRAGVCGQMSGENVVSVTSVCIRIPRSVYGIGGGLVKRLLVSDGGLLIYSPPGVGKTTLLRDIAATLSSPPYLKRVAVIDSRCEIYREDAFRRSIADIYLSYPKNTAIELAVRTMSPQYIVCDELGESDTDTLISTRSFGVPLIATAHSPSLPSLMKRECFRRLHDLGMFSIYVGIKREGRGFSFDISEGDKAL